MNKFRSWNYGFILLKMGKEDENIIWGWEGYNLLIKGYINKMELEFCFDVNI